MRRAYLSFAIALLFGCGSNETPQEPANSETTELKGVTLTFPEAASGTLPYLPGGRFEVLLSANVGVLCGATRATLEVEEGRLLLPALSPVTVSLSPATECQAHQARAALTYPPGGAINVKVSGAGKELSFPVEIDRPQVALQFGAGQVEGGRLKVPLCIESSAASGSVDLKLQQAVFGSGADTASLQLETGACAEPPLLGSPRHSMRRVAVFATGEQVTAAVALSGIAGVTDTESISVTPPAPVTLVVTSSPEMFSAPRDVVEISVSATLSGNPAADVPVRFETVPPTNLAPVTTLTNSAGVAKTSVEIPKGAVAVRVDAIAGSTRTGVTVRQAP